MMKIAVLLTVFNRREVTLRGLKSLYKAIDYLGEGYQFDIYMTDDGCTDGTGVAVLLEFPEVRIIQGDGNLYWSGGMRKAWQTAMDSGIHYDYFLWFNDDAELYDNALVLLFEPMNNLGKRFFVSGAFKDYEGKPSYGGRDINKKLLKPNGDYQSIMFMNGNLTIIPQEAVSEIGLLDETFLHIGGDWDYGLRALKKGYEVVLSRDYVGVTNRHDGTEFKGNFTQRIKNLYSIKHHPNMVFIFNNRHFGVIYAIKEYLKQHILLIMP